MDYKTNWSKILGIVLQFVVLQCSASAECDQADHDIILTRATALYDSILVGDIEGYGFNGALLSSREMAVEICNDYMYFKASIVNLLPKCQNDRVVKSLRTYLQYLCFDGRREFFNNYECIQNSFKNTQMLRCSGLNARYEADIKNIYSARTDRLKATCKVARYTAACLASNTTVLCGVNAGDVIFNVMKHSTESTFADGIISCHVTERDVLKVSYDVNDIEGGSYGYGTTVKNPQSMEQKVPECFDGQGAGTTFKLSELTRCIKPLQSFVRKRWNALQAELAIITERDQNNLCRAFSDFKMCILNARSNCDLIDSHLAGLEEAYVNFCSASNDDIQTYNQCSRPSRRSTTRCLSPFMNYSPKPDISVYENVSRLCKTLVESVGCVVDSTQIFIDNCPKRAGMFGVNLFMAYVSTMNITTQVAYYHTTKGICQAYLPSWYEHEDTGKITPSKNYYRPGGHDGSDVSSVTLVTSSMVLVVTLTLLNMVFVRFIS